MTIDSVQPAATLASAPVSSPVPSEQVSQRRDLIQAVKALNASEFFGQNSELTFVLDPETRRPLVRLIDRETNEVIQQIPPEYVLRVAANLKESASEGVGRDDKSL